MGGAVTGFTKALARERADALVKAVDFAPSRKTAALADVAGRGDAARPRRGRGRPRRRPALDGRPGRAAGRARPGARARSRHGLRRHRRGRQHRLGDHRRPRGAPPAAPSTCSTSCPSPTPPTPTSSASPPTATGSSASSPSASASAASGRRPKLVERELARHRARPRGARRASRRSARPAARRTGTRSTSPTRRRSTAALAPACASERPRRRAAALRRARDQPLPARQAAARVRPRLRRQGRRLVQPAARARATPRSATAVVVQLDRRPLRQRRPDRLRGRQRPAVQEHLDACAATRPARAASRSTGPRGRASAWPAAARSRR